MIWIALFVFHRLLRCTMKPLLTLLVFCLSLTTLASSVNAEPKMDQKWDPAKLQLKDLYPEKSMFGPSASSPEFSHDGRYAAYMYRPYLERRHGSDLWIYDFKTSKASRLTKIDVMSEFQRSARLVIADRLKKHTSKEKSGKKKPNDNEAKNSKESTSEDNEKSMDEDEEDDQSEQELSEEEKEKQREIYLTVSDKDADDDYAPVYSGISTFQWHPTDNSLLLISEGDIYYIEDIAKPQLSRLTKTSERESQVEFLPDGSGYTYGSDDAVIRVKFDDHVIEQLNPPLTSDESLSEYQISPDGKRIAIVSRTGSRSGARTVDIIRYRDRFAKSDKVSRTVSDDEVKPREIKVYLYDLDVADIEQAPLIQVFEETIDEPRDVMSTPNWSLDNQQVTFCFFDQKNSDVQIRLVTWPTKKEIA
jgi:hypothetical protein